MSYANNKAWKERFIKRDPVAYQKYYNEAARRYRARHPDRVKKSRFKWYAENLPKYILMRAKQGAKSRGIPFNLNLAWVELKLAHGYCEITGMPFDFVWDTGAQRPFKPSIDRIDSSKGYFEENCQMVIWMYNCCKGPNGHSDVVKFARALVDMEDLL